MRSTPPSFGYPNPLLERMGQDFFRRIPRNPGVYFMHGEDGEILYIGKAKDLRARLAFYKNAKPGGAPEHTIELIENVSRIRWEEHRDEPSAILRENELLHAVRPPFNIAGTEPLEYLYIGLRAEELPSNGRSPGEDRIRLRFHLTSRREIAEGYRLFGCFKHRRRVKTGYTALLRLLHAATSRQARFGFPARITRSSPPYLYSMDVPRDIAPPLERFLAGRGFALLRLILDRMLANEAIPRFMRPSIQDDLDVVREFYRHGPEATYRLMRRHGLRTRMLTHRRMDQLIRMSCAEPET